MQTALVGILLGSSKLICRYATIYWFYFSIPVFPIPSLNSPIFANEQTSVITYVRPSEQKRNVNREFHERFPFIQLTLTKLRSIKSTLVRISQRVRFCDLSA